MYDNIGGKIKSLAKASFIFASIVEIIAGLALIASEEMILTGLLVLVLGPVVSWVSSWMLYGFGELIDKACEIEQNTRSGLAKSSAQAKADSERIAKIEKLRSQGLITEEEYQRAISKKQ